MIHQLALPVHPPLLGSNEHRLAGSRAGFIAALNAELRRLADSDGVDVLALDEQAARDGIAAWHNPELWHRAKQEVTPAAAPMYGDLVMRLVAAHRGRSYKALVIDLDNTIWGGVVGDDGVEGLVLGQGSALGEAFVQFQHYARELSRRGIILAVVSKNDEKNALEPFERHPEMALKRDDIASFIANWSDKPANLRAVAEELNIGLDALVFVDDNPFERDLVRRELPMVAVPEVTDDPTTYAQTLADAGYFEAVAITAEDRARSGQYQSNRQRNELKASATDLDFVSARAGDAPHVAALRPRRAQPHSPAHQQNQPVQPDDPALQRSRCARASWTTTAPSALSCASSTGLATTALAAHCQASASGACHSATPSCTRIAVIPGSSTLAPAQ